MTKTWVLHTETKGTGAQVVPLESVTKRSSEVEPVFVSRERRAAPTPETPTPRPARRFRIVDLMTLEVLAEDASTAEAVELLKGVRSTVDVNVYVWQDEDERWRLLTLGEQGALWDLSRS
jgi:hypothetical protein